MKTKKEILKSIACTNIKIAKIIFRYENDGFYLTEDQRLEAYNEYKTKR